MPLRILVFATTMVWDNLVSGGDKIFVEISKRLDEKYYAVNVITTESGEKLWGKSPKARIWRLPLITSRNFSRRGLVPFIYLLRTVQACSQPSSWVDIVYSSSDFLSDVVPALWARLRHRKTVWISRIYHVIPSPGKRRGNLLMNMLSFSGQRFCFSLIKRYADIILALNNSLYQELLALGFPENRLEISGGGVDLGEIMKVKPSATRGYDAVFLGRLHPSKGIYDAIRIWMGVVSEMKDTRLAIIGGADNDTWRLIQEHITQSHMGRNIDMLGFVEKDVEIFSILKAAKLFLFTDHENGWSLATCEAMACGLPVVAYDLPIFGDVYRKGFVRVPRLDAPAFVKRILSLLRDEKMRSELAKQALEQARSFDWSEIAAGFANLLDKSMETNHAENPLQISKGNSSG